MCYKNKELNVESVAVKAPNTAEEDRTRKKKNSPQTKQQNINEDMHRSVVFTLSKLAACKYLQQNMFMLLVFIK